MFDSRVRRLACHGKMEDRGGRRIEVASQTDRRERERDRERDRGALKKESQSEVVELLSSTPTESHDLSFYPTPVVLSRSTLENNVYLR